MTISSVTQPVANFFIKAYNYVAGSIVGRSVSAFFNLPVVSTVSNVALTVIENKWVQVTAAAASTAYFANRAVANRKSTNITDAALPAILAVGTAVAGVYVIVRT